MQGVYGVTVKGVGVIFIFIFFPPPLHCAKVLLSLICLERV